MTVEEIRSGNENSVKFPVGLRVLAVDDDPICLKILETLLKKCEYQVTTTSQAKNALKMLRDDNDRFDLVISDVHMPDMDGFKLLELVGLELDLPVIMLSGNSDPKLVMKGMIHGACDYLVKPVGLEELRNIWQHVLRRKKFDSNKSGGQDCRESRERNESPPLDPNGRFESQENDRESEGPTAQKKPSVVWSIDLHRKFVAAVNQLGIEKAVPKRILDLMDVPGLTRANVASHLQKYRLYLKRIIAATQQLNMAAESGNHDSSSVRMPQFDVLGDFRILSQITNTPLLPYTDGGGMLSGLNSHTNMNLHNLPLSALIQLGQNTSLCQEIPTPLGVNQMQKEQCTNGNVHFNGNNNNPMMFHEKGGFGNQSFNDSEFSNVQQNSVLPTEPFVNRLPLNCNNISSNGPFSQADLMNLKDSKQNYCHISNNNYVSPLNQTMDSSSGGEGAPLIQNGKLKLENGIFSQSYDSMDDLMTAMFKRALGFICIWCPVDA